MIAVAIDGPAGAGKSTIAKAAAKKLGFLYVDTGALYRATGLKFLNLGYDTKLDCDIDTILAQTDVDFKYIDGVQHVFLDGTDVTAEIRTPDASMMASAVSAKPQVRAFLLEMQRKIARENNVIMDGRDIGTVVLPDAKIKIFLTASAEIRAERRYKELIEKGESVSFEDVLADIEKRDYNDSHREIAPLRPAENSILYDSSEKDLQTNIDELVKIIEERM